MSVKEGERAKKSQINFIDISKKMLNLCLKML